MRAIVGGIRRLTTLGSEELMTEAKSLGAPYDLVRWVAENGRLPVVLFTAGGMAKPAERALRMHLGADGGSAGGAFFRGGDRKRGARAMGKAATHFGEAKAGAELGKGLGGGM